jgi:hypothetical protein
LGLVTHERTGSCYTLGYSLVHQTVMEADTVTLFMRGPREQRRSYAALDMLDRQNVGADSASSGEVSSGEVVKRHTDGARALRPDEYEELCGRLTALGLLDPVDA